MSIQKFDYPYEKSNKLSLHPKIKHKSKQNKNNTLFL